MTRISGWSLPLALILTAPSLASAQDEGVCNGVFLTPEPGDFAELHISATSGDDLDVRFAIVGAESLDGVIHYWMEIVAVRSATGERVLTQLLVPDYPFDVREVKGYVVKVRDEPAMRIPQHLIEQMASGANEMAWQAACDEATDLGTGEVSVAAGSFSARHFETRDDDGTRGEAWLTPDVPFSVVLMSNADGVMELIRFGDDALSELAEVPVDFKMPRGN